MTSELALASGRRKTVLEVGAGTGSVTAEIVRHLGSGDELDIFEIDQRLADLLERRLKTDRRFSGVTATVRIHAAPIEEIAADARYDYVISCLPFTNFQPLAVRRIFELYRSLLKPGGVCSFYEYILLRRAMRLMSGSPKLRRRVTGVGKVVKEYVFNYGYRQEVVLRNLPPAAVHHVRFHG